MIKFLFLFCLFAIAQAKAQHVSINHGYSNLEVGQPYYFSASVSKLSKGQSVTQWTWSVQDLGRGGSLNGQISNSTTGTLSQSTSTSSTSSNAIIIWQHLYARRVRIIARATISSVDAQGNVSTRDIHQKIYLQVLDVCPPRISGPNPVQQCCTSPLTYTANDFCDADYFVWTVPNGWTIQSGQNTRTLVVVPPYSHRPNAGIISCRAYRMAAPGRPTELTELQITSYYPSANISAIPNALYNICPNETHTYSIEPSCGVQSYTWQFPLGWTVQSGQNTNSVTAWTGTNPRQGDVRVYANYGANSPCNVADTQHLDVIRDGVAAFRVQNRPDEFDYTYFHCNRWWFCANSSHNYITGQAYRQTERVIWQISAPWHFRLPNGTRTRSVTWNVNYTQTMNLVSPAIGCDNNGVGSSSGGTVTITTGNCLGATSTTQAFSRELSTFCRGNTSCYPAHCACCGSNSGCAQNPLRPDIDPQNQPSTEDISFEEISFGNEPLSTENMDEENVSVWVNDLVEIYPNPSTGIFYVQSKEIIETIRIFDTQGRLVYEQNNPNSQTEINLQQQPSGIYWLQSIAKGSSKTTKIILAK